jgi:integrase
VAERTAGQDLLGAISRKGLRGKRDAAMLSLLLACGLRRSEVVGLACERIQRREDHWAIVDLLVAVADQDEAGPVVGVAVFRRGEETCHRLLQRSGFSRAAA